MAMLRRLAERWLRAVVRHAPRSCRPWASAMLRELDFIESDWAALLWALGSTAAVSRQWLRSWRAWISGQSEEEPAMKGTAMKVTDLLLGVLMAVGAAVGAFALLLLVFYLFPALHHAPIPWPAWVFSGMLEVLFVAGTVKFWKTRRPMAIGILLAALVFTTHFAMHIASRWNG